MGAMTPMPQYQSHKKVWALKISKIHWDEDGQGIGVVFEDKAFSMRAFTAAQLKGKPTPEPGWYMVQYEDGYISFSPEKAFEEGYTLVGSKKRPTIKELEDILNSEEDALITINSDGSITEKSFLKGPHSDVETRSSSHRSGHPGHRRCS